MSAPQGKETEFFEGFSGPNLEYAWIAEVSRDPSPQGLDGGRVVYFNVVKEVPRQIGEAPRSESLSALDGITQPRDVRVARFENGRLTCDAADAHASDVVAELREKFTDNNMEFWGDQFPEKELHNSKKRASRARAREDSREPER